MELELTLGLMVAMPAIVAESSERRNVYIRGEFSRLDGRRSCEFLDRCRI